MKVWIAFRSVSFHPFMKIHLRYLPESSADRCPIELVKSTRDRVDDSRMSRKSVDNASDYANGKDR